MTRVGPTKQPFSWRALAGDLLEQTKDVIQELSWYPAIIGRHLTADVKHKASRAKFAERAALEIEALTKEPVGGS